MEALVYNDLAAKTLALSLTGGNFNFPRLIEGETLKLSTRFAQRIERDLVEVERNVQAFRVSVGYVDQRPTGGTFRLKIGEAETDELDYNISAEGLQTALAALDPGAEDYSAPEVTLENGSYLVTYEGEEAEDFPELELGLNCLKPECFVEITAEDCPGHRVFEIRAAQTPLCATDVWERILPPAPEVATITDGFELDGLVGNEVQSLTVHPSFRGVYRIKRGDRVTIGLSVADGAEQIATAMNAALLTEEEAARGGEFLVTNPVDYAVHIEFAGDLGGQDHEELELEVIDAPPGDVTVVLPLTGPRLSGAFRAKPEIKVILEIWALFEDGDESEWTTPLYRGEVTILRRVDVANGVVAARDWAVPPSPETYRPFSADQIIITTRHYVDVLEEGAVHAIDHGLETEEIASVTVRENVAGGAALVHGVDFNWETTSEDVITLTLLGDYAEAEAGDLAVVISTAGPEEHFLAHTHTIEDVTGLSAALAAIGGRLDLLEAIAPTGSIARREDPAGTVALWRLPEIGLVLPTRSEVTVPLGLIDLKLGDVRNGGLLPAVHDASVENLTVPLPDPGSSYHGKVYTNASGSAVELPGGGGRRAVKLQAGEFAACWYSTERQVGYWYRVTQYEASGKSTYYPSDFDVTLFEIPVLEEQFRVGRTLALDFAITTAIYNSQTRGQWALVLEFGNPQTETSPGTTTVNFNGLDWNEDAPALNQRLILTPVPTTHQFGLRVYREWEGEEAVISADIVRYGDTVAAASVPVAANFALRARLTRFDVGPELDPRGLVAVSGLQWLDAETGEPAANSGMITIK